MCISSRMLFSRRASCRVGATATHATSSPSGTSSSNAMRMESWFAASVRCAAPFRWRTHRRSLPRGASEGPALALAIVTRAPHSTPLAAGGFVHVDSAPRVSAVGRALPRHRVEQEQIIGALRGYWGAAHFNVDRLEELHRAVQVTARHLALPVEAYAGLDTFQKSNDAWIAAAEQLGEEAVRTALDRAGLAPHDVDHLVFVTVTGV